MDEQIFKEIEETVATVKKDYTKNDYCFALMSDTRLSDTVDRTLKYISSIDKNVKIDSVIHLGNVLLGNVPRKISMELLNIEFERIRKSISSGRLFPTQGDRDGYRDENFPGQLVTDIMYDKLWYENTSFINAYKYIKRDKGKPYYYYDVPDKKIRLVFLCSYYSQINEKNYFYEKYTTIDVEQAVWLKNKALNVEKGTAVLLFSHRIPKSSFENGEEPFMYNGRYTEPLLCTLQAKKREGINIAAWFCGAYGQFEISNNGGINFISVKNHESSDVISDDSYDLGCDIITVMPEKRTLKIISSMGKYSTSVIY